MNTTLKLITLAAIAACTSAAMAAPETFDFKDPKNVNNVTFHLDAHLEAINGSASGISGTVTYDPEHPDKTTGKIAVASSSMMVPNPMMRDVLLGNQWMDVTKFPEISFTLKDLKNVKTDDNVTTADATGTFACKGVSKEITVPVKFTYLKDKLAERLQGMPGKHEGDLLVIRSHFTIKRSDYNINPGQYEDKVANEIELNLAIAGAAPK